MKEAKDQNVAAGHNALQFVFKQAMNSCYGKLVTKMERQKKEYVSHKRYMKKYVPLDSDGFDNPNTKLVKEEVWDIRKLEKICRLKSLDPNLKRACRTTLKKVKKSEEGNRMRVAYRFSRRLDSGRLYGDEGSLQGIKSRIRRLCGGKYYHDVDISNCAPTLLCQLVEKTFGEAPTLLKRYVEDREGIFKDIQKERPDLDKTTLKKAFLAIVNGGRGLQQEEKDPSCDHETVESGLEGPIEKDVESR